MILRPIEQCDRCRMTLQARDVIIVGYTGGEHLKTWWKLCPKCNLELQNKYVKGLDISKKTQKKIGLDSGDIKKTLIESAKFWKNDF